MSKLAVLQGGQRSGKRCKEDAVAVVELTGSTAKRVSDKRVALEVCDKPWLEPPRLDQHQRPAGQQLTAAYRSVRHSPFCLLQAGGLV